MLIRRKVDHAMTDWLAATGSGSLSKEVLTFLRDEVRLRMTDSTDPDPLLKIINIKRSFEQFISTILIDGLPASMNSPSWRIAETRQRNAETMAWAVINSFSITLAHVNNPEKLVRVVWPDTRIVAPDADLSVLPLIGIDLRGAQMQGAIFIGCFLINANLSGANLEGCDFQRAMLDDADLEGASLKSANLRDARITGDTTTDVTYEPTGKIVRRGKEILLNRTLISEQSLLYADLEYFRTKTDLLQKPFRPSEGDTKGDIFTRASEIRKIIKSIPELPVGLR